MEQRQIYHLREKSLTWGNNMNTFEKIYEVVKKIPKGKVATYGQIAAYAGNPRWSRVVGYALHVNPSPNTLLQGGKQRGKALRGFCFRRNKRTAAFARSRGDRGKRFNS